ncbi:MAG: hypothetical protein GKR99_12345 [Rhodobacteraceae bacterium]|nr:hypothetical protein [Paracoccaceae bacterium]
MSGLILERSELLLLYKLPVTYVPLPTPGRALARLMLLLALLPTATLAEGRDDPFLRCAFEQGRQVILSERGDDFVWTEDGKGTVAAFLRRADGDPLATLYTYLPDRGPQTLTLDLDAMAAAGGNLPPVGTAMIVTPALDSSGRLTPIVQYGRCVEFIG